MSSKRANDFQLTRDDTERGGEGGPSDEISEVTIASAQVLAGRKIAQPRSLRARQGASASPFGAFATSTPAHAAPAPAVAAPVAQAATSSNPFALFSSKPATPAPAPAQFSATPAVFSPAVSTSSVPASANTSTTQIGAEEPSYKLFKALNEKFLIKLQQYANSALNGSDWSHVCELYISQAKTIVKSPAPAAAPVATPAPAPAAAPEPEKPVQQYAPPAGFQWPTAKPKKVEEPKPEGKITSAGFSFSGASSSGSDFSFGGKVISSTATKPSTSNGAGFVFEPNGTGKVVTNADKSDVSIDKSVDESIDQSIDQSADKTVDKSDSEMQASPEKPEPKFTFGKPSEAPAFTFGQNAPAFTFGQPAAQPKDTTEPSKPAFTFGQPAKPADTPKFEFGKDTKTEAPKFTFGEPTTFKFDAAGGEYKPAEKKTEAPKFTFGEPTAKPTEQKTETPKFTFGEPTTFKFDAPEKKAEAPKFTFGQPSTFKFDGANASGEPKPFTFGGAAPLATPAAAPAAGAEDEDEDAQNDPQTDLSGKGAGEENEDSVYEKKAKIYELKDSKYEVLGLGFLRVLVDKATKKSRVLVRAEGSGRVLINVAVRAQIKYTVEGKNQVRLLDFRSQEEKPVTYLVRVKAETDAQELRDKLEEIKS